MYVFCMFYMYRLQNKHIFNFHFTLMNWSNYESLIEQFHFTFTFMCAQSKGTKNVLAAALKIIVGPRITLYIRMYIILSKFKLLVS